MAPFFLLICFLWLGFSIKGKIGLLGRKPLSLLIVFTSSFWLLWMLWHKLKTCSKEFYKLQKYVWLYVPAYWSIGFGLYLFTGIQFFGFGPLSLSEKDEVTLASGFISSHVFYLSGWIVLTCWFSISQSVMEKIQNFKRPGYYSIIIFAVLCLLMLLNPDKAAPPVTYSDLSPDLILLLVEALYLLLFLMILLSLCNTRKTVRLIGIMSCVLIGLFTLLTPIGTNYINRFTYNFFFFGPTILFAILSVQLILWLVLCLLIKKPRS